MNILVTGANGQLGCELRYLVEQLDAEGKTKHNYIFTSQSGTNKENNETLKKLLGRELVSSDVIKLDITNYDLLYDFVKEGGFKVIINCAAYTNVEKAQDEYDLANQVNNKAVRNMARIMKEVGGVLIHISTDYVFDGKQNWPYLECNFPTSINNYGQTKLMGELSIDVIGCRHLTIRTSWLYSEFGKNFLKTMMSLTTTKDEVKVVFDQIGSPTYALDLAEFILKVCEENKLDDIKETNSFNDTYHFTNEGICSWYDFAYKIASSLDNAKAKITPCYTRDFPSKARRPRYSVLDKNKVKTTFNVNIPYWSDQVEKCINNIKIINK